MAVRGWNSLCLGKLPDPFLPITQQRKWRKGSGLRETRQLLVEEDPSACCSSSGQAQEPLACMRQQASVPCRRAYNIIMMGVLQRGHVCLFLITTITQLIRKQVYPHLPLFRDEPLLALISNFLLHPAEMSSLSCQNQLSSSFLQ